MISHDCKRYPPACNKSDRTDESHSTGTSPSSNKCYTDTHYYRRQGYQPPAAKSLKRFRASLSAAWIARSHSQASVEPCRHHRTYSSEDEGKHARTNAT
jgi:hypothetical protein